jgi:hypothetical protein
VLNTRPGTQGRTVYFLFFDVTLFPDSKITPRLHLVFGGVFRNSLLISQLRLREIDATTTARTNTRAHKSEHLLSPRRV